jgi:dTDP-4-dehydrorhamnose 3,5-epimerase
MKSNIQVHDLNIIPVEGGNVQHFLRSDESSFNGFGEAYFSFIEKGKIKGWKLHTRMTMNLVVPVGEVGFVFYIESNSTFQVLKIGTNNYKRLTVPPNIWFGFKGLGLYSNLVVNLSNIIHDPSESKKAEISRLKFDWNQL